MPNNFFQTLMGKKFYGADIPKIVNALERIADEMKRTNDIAEKQERKPFKVPYTYFGKEKIEGLNDSIQDK